MPELFQFFFFGYGNITRLLLRLPLLMCVAPFMETAVFHVLFPDVAGNAPDSAFPKDCGIEAVVLQNLPGKLSCLVFRKKDLLKLLGKVQLKLGYAVGVWVLAQHQYLLIGKGFSAHGIPPVVHLRIP